MLLKAPVKNKTSISITPLIDVVFILLLFFMLSSTFQHENQIEMNSSLLGGQAKEQNKSHKLLLDLNDMILIDGVKYLLSSEDFEKRLAEFIKNDDFITLAANPEVKIQKFIQLLDSLSSLGISNLNISKSEMP